MTEGEADGDTTTRERIREAIERYPGIHFRGIVKELDLSTALVRYHIEILLEEGAVRAHEVGGYTRYFPEASYGELSEEEREQLEVLRQERPLEIVLALLEFGPMQHKDLVEITGLSKGTVTYHLKKLRTAGLVRRVPQGEDRGFHLGDEDAVRALLARYEPASEVLERVHDLWDDLFGGHRAG